jgi:hypothetical protein
MVLFRDLLGELGVLGLFPRADGFDGSQGIVEDEGTK